MRILISGDSWSQGEWDGDWKSTPSTYCVHHRGINQYLTDAGYVVDNVGQGAIGNYRALDSLEHRLQHETYNFIVFFYTDPLRDASNEQLRNILPYELVKSIMLHVVDRLNFIKQKYESKIILIGGYAELAHDLDIGQIDFIIPSFCKLICPEFNDSIYSMSPEWKHNINLSIIGNVEQKQQYLDIFAHGTNKFREFKKYPEYFYPDGVHANRHAHRLLTDKILELLAV